MDAEIQAMDGNQTTVQVLDSGDLQSHSFLIVETRAKREGVCNPFANVWCKATAPGTAQNVSDGITYPLRL